MKRVLSCGAVALLLLVTAADASAQGKLSGFAALGPTTTTGDLKDADSTKSGFIVQGGLEYKLSAPLWLRRVSRFRQGLNARGCEHVVGWRRRIGAVENARVKRLTVLLGQ